MTREEQYIEAANPYIDDPLRYLGFMDGAEWADSHPHWISVEDELPKIETEVLMVSSGYTGPLYGYRCNDGKKGWYCYNDDNYWHNITHWMPLPAIEGIRENQGEISPNDEGGKQ